MNHPLLIIGSQRSGTTLLNRLLGNHDKVSILYQQTEILREFFECDTAIASSKAQEIVHHTKKFMNSYGTVFPDKLEQEICSSFLDKSGPIPLSSVYKKVILGLLNDAPSPGYWGEKYAGRCLEVQKFIELFPDGKIIHIYRDPRDVYYSEKKRLANSRFDFLLTLYDWKVGIQLMQRYKKFLSTDCYFTVPFEKLVKNPSETISDLCDFLDIDYLETLLDISKSTDMHGNTFTANSSFTNGVTEIRSDFANRWRSIGTKKELFFIESFCKKEMQYLGYDTSSYSTLTKINFIQYYFLKAASRKLRINIFKVATQYANHNAYQPYFPPSNDEGKDRPL